MPAAVGLGLQVSNWPHAQEISSTNLWAFWNHQVQVQTLLANFTRQEISSELLPTDPEGRGLLALSIER